MPSSAFPSSRPLPIDPTASTRSGGRWRLAAAFSFLLLFALSESARSQPPAPDPGIRRAAMDRLDFLVGRWEGEGWTDVGAGRHRFTSTETVERRLGGATLLVEGLHRAVLPGGSDEPGAVVHHALALISWSEADGEYRFSTALSNRDGGTFRAWFEEDAFLWEIPAGPRTIRYVIRIDDAGRWVEDGSMSMDGGATWSHFFHMSLEPAD